MASAEGLLSGAKRATEHLRHDRERRSTDSHSDSSARTIKNATGVAKPFGAAAHHIASSGHREAEGSRTLPFGWGIGIDDADNGVNLRDIKYPCPKGLEKAPFKVRISPCWPGVVRLLWCHIIDAGGNVLES